ncbi:MAG: hypothetical protein NTY94_22695 [Alphaproteobacteria bacterium]|nr:hypothetical protein [Alphaproteobacteria bacterium]
MSEGAPFAVTKVLTFRQMFAELRESLEQDGFRYIGAEMFSDHRDPVSSWVAMLGNDRAFRPLFGVISKEVDKIVYKIIRKVYPHIKRTNSVPLFRIAPGIISPNDTRILHNKSRDLGYDEAEISDFIWWLREVAMPFLKSFSSLELCLDAAVEYNWAVPAGEFYIPALFLLFGRNTEADGFVEKTLNAMREVSDPTRFGYENYYVNLVLYFGGVPLNSMFKMNDSELVLTPP